MIKVVCKDDYGQTTSEYKYDNSGNLVLIVVEEPDDGGDMYTYTKTRKNDEKVAQREDGQEDDVIEFTYNSNNNFLKATRDRNVFVEYQFDAN